MKDETHLTVVVSSANQALVDDPIGECCRMLRLVIRSIKENEGADYVSELLRDVNGNRVGHFYFKMPEIQE